MKALGSFVVVAGNGSTVVVVFAVEPGVVAGEVPAEMAKAGMRSSLDGIAGAEAGWRTPRMCCCCALIPGLCSSC